MEAHYARHALQRLAKRQLRQERSGCMEEGAPTFLSACSRSAHPNGPTRMSALLGFLHAPWPVLELVPTAYCAL